MREPIRIYIYEHSKRHIHGEGYRMLALEEKLRDEGFCVLSEGDPCIYDTFVEFDTEEEAVNFKLKHL